MTRKCYFRVQHMYNMAAPKCVLVSFALILICEISSSERNTHDFLKREHTLVKPYQATSMNNPTWDFIGSTILTSNYIRLTSDHQSRQGAIWNSVPCRVRNWELHVQFNVHGSGKNLFGDGFAIWYTKHRLQLGPVFGSMDYFVGLAIFLDTYSNHNGPHNHQHPYVSAMINNGSLHYDHDRDGTHTALKGCEAQFRNKPHDTFIAIRYHGTTLKVSLDIDGKNSWKECFTAHGVYLPPGYFFGASAATGDLADNHDIISMKLYEIDSPGDTAQEYFGLPKAENVEPPREHVDDHRNTVSGWKIFFIIILVLLGIAVCGVVGYVIFMKSQENSRKRLY